MKAAEIIAKLDDLSASLGDSELCAWLENACGEYEARESADAAGIAALYNELGGICRRNKWLEKGESAFVKAVSCLENAGINDGNDATTLNNLAGLYRLSGDFERSLDLFTKARELYAALPGLPADTLASVHNNIGLLHLDAKRYSEALREFETAEGIIAAIPENHYVHAVTAGNSAFAYFRLGDIERARERMLRAAMLAENIPDGGAMQGNYMNLYRQLGGRQ